MDRDRGGLGEDLKRQRLYVVETKGLREARGSILVTGGVPGAKFDEVVEVVLASGEAKLGRVIEVAKDFTVIQVFGGVSEVDLTGCKVRFKGETLKLPVSNDMLGRIFNGRGEPIDGGPRIVPEDYLDINGEPINPAAREPPSEFIETGISTIDGLNSLVRGQKLPIFSGSGLPHNRVVAQIIRQAAVRGEGEGFAVVFGAVGISYDDAAFFMKSLEGTGGLERTVAFINTASDPTIERIVTPRLALTAAEFLAWREGLQALVILADMTNYCEALRELSAMREEVPGRRGYPGYMYTDLATMYERAGRISGRRGSVTIMPVLTMPDDDITHPIPDLTGYITEGQLVLSRGLERKGIYPPMDVFLSLSRMMKEGIGPGKTREDHRGVFMQLYAAYSEGNYLREISTIVGTESLTERDRIYLKFADEFERRFISQGEFERRDIETTLDIAWDILSMLPEGDLKLIPEEFIEKYHPAYGGRGRVAAKA
ncbi:MAG: V-type ATP synthase subunit B, partial [Candidatus Bathyarchaeia archaeon]